MRDREPTIRSRELGEGLHRAMRQAGLDQKDAVQKLGWSQSRVSRLLSGKRGGTEVDVSAFLAVAEVTGAERERLLGICREQNIPGLAAAAQHPAAPAAAHPDRPREQGADHRGLRADAGARPVADH